MNKIHTTIIPRKTANRIVKKKNNSFFNFDAGPAFFQPKLAIGPADDSYEREADAVADKVMQTPDNPLLQPKVPRIVVQRKCKECEEEEKEKVQRKEIDNHAGSLSSSNLIDRAIRSNGQPLDGNTRSFMENRFGHDFSGVKIHTGSVAAKSAQSINALAYTSGNNVVFNEGKYAPGAENGRRLLAHELTHVVQQKGSRKIIQRACSPADQTEYDKKAVEIRQLPLYKKVPKHKDAIKTPKETREIAEKIISQAKARDNCKFYIDHLYTLFSTQEAPPAVVGEKWKKVLSEAAQSEEERLKDPQSKIDAGFEESLSGDAQRQWKQLKGRSDKIYYVDDSDLNNIVIKVKVRLKGKKEYVDQAKQLQDGIEKEASILGYTIDINFVNTSGKDVFEAKVDPTKWPTSGNWVGDAEVMAHELHHILNLPDRYNYIESHAGNEKMYIANRIHWFWKEFNRQPDPNKMISFMGKGSLVTDEDICAAIQSGNLSACVTQRQSLRTKATGIKNGAFAKVQRLIEVLSGIIPPFLLNPRANVASTVTQAQNRIKQTAQLVFKTKMSDAAMETSLRKMRGNLISGKVYMENTTAPKCRNEKMYFLEKPRTFVICPSFNNLSVDKQQQELLRVSYRMHQELSMEGKRATMIGNPMDPKKAEKWAEFVMTAYNRI